MRHTFKTSQWVGHPVERVFAFFADPGNLPGLMPAWQHARIEDAQYVLPPPRSISGLHEAVFAAGAGSRMTLTFRPFPLSPVRMKWIALISEFEWDDHFCDEQPQGPFAYWHHCHRVLSEQQGGMAGTRVFDDLTYELPFGSLAEPAHWLFVRRQIEAMFAFRQRRLTELLKQP